MAEKKEIYRTPVGTIKFPVLNDPEINQQGKETWSCVLAMDPKNPEFVTFERKMGDALAKVKGANCLFFKNDKSRNDEGVIAENGLKTMSFKSYFRPRFFDSARNPIDIKVGWGTEAIIAFNLVEFRDIRGKTGLARYIQGIQIIKLKTGERDADSCGFEEIKDGYRQDETSVVTGEDPWDE